MIARTKCTLLIAFGLSGVQLVGQNTFTNTGTNVGIGTTSPTSLLDVRGNITAPSLTTSDVAAHLGDVLTHDGKAMYNAGIKWLNDSWCGDGSSLWVSGYGGIKLFTNRQPRLAINKIGNVGINTISPQGFLHVKATGNGQVPLVIEGANLFALQVKTLGTGDVNTATHRLSQVYNFDNVDRNGYIEFIRGGDNSNGALAFGSNGTERIRVSSNGNVGIGTTAPLANLHIQNPSTATNTAIIRLSALQGAGYTTEIINEFNTNNAFQIKQNGFNILRSSGNGDALIELGHRDNKQLNLLTHTTGKVTVPNARLIIGAEPAAGSPLLADASNKLLVNGSIGAKKVRVTQNGWPDYVFDGNYDLMPLAQVADFIAQNKHLPQVPSAKEVEKEGIDLGDNQALLLRKIEELTLYIIAQQKQIDELKKAVGAK